MVQPKLYLNDHGGAIRRRYSQDLIVGYRDDAKKQERKTGLVVSNHPGGRHAGVDLCERIQAASRTAFSSRSEEHTSELQSRLHLVCRLLLEKKKSHHRQFSLSMHYT